MVKMWPIHLFLTGTSSKDCRIAAQLLPLWSSCGGLFDSSDKVLGGGNFPIFVKARAQFGSSSLAGEIFAYLHWGCGPLRISPDLRSGLLCDQ